MCAMTLRSSLGFVSGVADSPASKAFAILCLALVMRSLNAAAAALPSELAAASGMRVGARWWARRV